MLGRDGGPSPGVTSQEDQVGPTEDRPGAGTHSTVGHSQGGAGGRAVGGVGADCGDKQGCGGSKGPERRGSTWSPAPGRLPSLHLPVGSGAPRWGGFPEMQPHPSQVFAIQPRVQASWRPCGGTRLQGTLRELSVATWPREPALVHGRRAQRTLGLSAAFPAMRVQGPGDVRVWERPPREGMPPTSPPHTASASLLGWSGTHHPSGLRPGLVGGLSLEPDGPQETAECSLTRGSFASAWAGTDWGHLCGD